MDANLDVTPKDADARTMIKCRLGCMCTDCHNTLNNEDQSEEKKLFKWKISGKSLCVENVCNPCAHAELMTWRQMLNGVGIWRDSGSRWIYSSIF